MSVTDEIKARLDIVELVGGYVHLQKAGKNFRALCPFHSEKTPSFYVFPDSQRWHCFGACGEGGDIFSFVMKKEGWDFGTALEELARRAGVELRPRTPAQVEADKVSDRLREAVAQAADYYHHLLLHAPEGETARQYLARRGLDEQTWARFQLGYSLPGWTHLRAHLTGQGFTLAELIHAGLLGERDDGSTYDRFRGRLMILIRDARGRPIGFGARTLDPKGTPKYINSPQTPIFDKGKTLFGFDLARDAIRKADRVVIVEGYMDVMQAHQAGFGNVVAQMGTALTEPQVRLLKRHTRRFVLALDPDAAGAQATLRGVEVARETLDREWEPVFNPRGLVGFEGRLGAEILILSLPAGYDPDDLIRTDPDQWRTLVDQALPVVEFYQNMLLAEADLGNAKERARVVEVMLPLLRDVADPVEREVYAQKLARALDIQTRTILDRLHTARKQRGRRPARSQTEPSSRQKADLEGYCLATLMAQPDLLISINRLLEEQQVPPLCERDFIDTAYRIAFQNWKRHGAKRIRNPDESREWMPDVAVERLLPLWPDLEELAEEQRLREGIQTVLRLRERNLRQAGLELQMMWEEAEKEKSDQAARYGQALAENARMILRVQQALRTREWVRVAGEVEQRE